MAELGDLQLADAGFRCIDDPEPALRQDIFTYARLFNLVVHYELGNFELLESWMNTATGMC